MGNSIYHNSVKFRSNFFANRNETYFIDPDFCVFARLPGEND